MPNKSKPKVRKFKVRKEKSVKKTKPAKKVTPQVEVEEKVAEQPQVEPPVIPVEQPSVLEPAVPIQNVASSPQEFQPLQPASSDVSPTTPSSEEKNEEIVAESQPEIVPEIKVETPAEDKIETPVEPQKPVEENTADTNTTVDVDAANTNKDVQNPAPTSVPIDANASAETPMTTPPWHLELDGVEKNGNNMFNKKTITIIVLVLFFLALGGIGFMSRSKINNLFDQKSSNNQSASVTVNKPPQPTATPTEEPVNLSLYKIKVLNGSGVTGAAGKVKTLLEDEGYTVISTGNADTSDYTETVIEASEDVKKGYLSKLSEFIGKTYTVSSKPGTLESSGSADVVIIVGSKEAK